MEAFSPVAGAPIGYRHVQIGIPAFLDARTLGSTPDEHGLRADSVLVPVGTGDLNWPGVLKAAADVGIERFVVEQDECEDDPFACTRVSFADLVAMGIRA